MAQTTPPVSNPPVTTCRHKACSECTTGWNVCCECLSGDSRHLMRWNIAHLPSLYRGDMQRTYCARCYEHWNARVRTTNDYPRALEVTPSHPLFPAAQQGRIPVVNLSGRLSSSARRRLRRTIKETTGSNIATCHTPLPDERASWTIGGPSATPATPSVRPVVEHLSLAERWERSKLLSPAERGELYSLLSPAEQEEWFKLFVEDRRSQVALARRTTNLEEETLGLSRGASSGRSVTARQLSALPVVASNNDIFYWHNYGLVSRPRGLQAGGPADVSALESSWALMTPIDPTTAIDTCDTDLELLSTITDPSDVAETARHASRLLDAFSSGNIEGPLSSTQQRLLSTALTSILALTHDRVDTAAQTDPLPPPVDAAAQTDPLPPPVDVSMRPDATCVVCFSRLVDTVLMPCWHLVLCGECCAEMRRRARPAAMQCPLCRRVVKKTPKVFRS